MEKEKTKVVSIRLPLDVAEFYEKKAKEFGISRSIFLNLALRLGTFVIDDSQGTANEEEFFEDFAKTAKKVAKNAVQKR